MRIVTYAVIVIAAGVMASSLAKSQFKAADKPAVIPPAAAGQAPDAPRKIKENVVAYTTGDAAMNAAKNKARLTLTRFRELRRTGPAGTATVKFPLTQNGATEHIWLQVSSDSGDKFIGRLANAPVNGAKYKMGDHMTVAMRDVEDWMINTGSEIYGGYTARVGLEQMPKAQQDKLRPMFRD